MIFPYAHEDHRGRRWPVVTIGLIVVNVLCLLAFDTATSAVSPQINAIARDAIEFRDAHPTVRDDCAPLARVPRRAPVQPRGRRPGARAPVVAPAPLASPADQAQFDAMCAAVEAAVAESPLATFGYTPAKNNLAGLFTYQFVHAGWLHLLSNLWFLWLCGVNVEDRWGRAVYLPFYLSAGVVAALAQKLLASNSLVPIVGASGAIAGAMGAFLVLFARTRIRFAYAFFLIRWGTFTAPAAVMLPLWLATEIFWGLLQESGVAHWAHVGGFVYGAVFALVLKRTGLDAKLDDAVEGTVSTTQDPRILRAGELIDAGLPSEAMTLLQRVAREKPRSIDVQLELLRAAKKGSFREQEREAYAKLIELYFEAGMPDPAADLFGEMASLDPHDQLSRGWVLRVAENLVSRALLQRAEAAYAAALREGVVDRTAVHATLAFARLLRQLGRADRARELLREARKSPFSSAELDGAIDGELAQTG
jgi:membrane associated rhomboid family serine protease